ncbi:hypothetical protein Tco_0475617 [Tanacetum coccineum]
MGSILFNGSPTSEFQFHKGLFSGIIIDSSLTLSHLFFADDVMFVVNLGIGTRREEVDVAATTMGCSTFTTPFVHLRVKVRGVLKLLESIRRNFFNGVDGSERKMAWISWNKVLASKKYGGLGVSTIYGEDGALNSLSSLSKRSPWLDIIREVTVLRTKGIYLSDLLHKKLIDDSILLKEKVAIRWVKVMPIKINVFAWRVRLDKMPTRLNISLKGIVYGRDQRKHVDVDGFVDANYAKDPNKGRSITRYVFMVHGCVVSWKTTLQHVVALSDAEYMALTKAVKESIWLKGLLIELGVNLRSVVVNCDNQSAIHLLRNAMFHERTKHINVRYHFIREIVESKKIKVAKIGMKDNAADAFKNVVSGYVEGIVYGRDQRKHVDVDGFVDANYAKDPDKGRSITGYVFTVHGCVVSWKATLQHVVALSTTEAEYMALTEAVKESIWLKGLLIELGVNLRSVVVNCDNQSAIHLSRNAMFHERTKHINVRYHFIREIVESKEIGVAKIGTKDNAADAFTKVVPGPKFKYCMKILGVGAN